MAHQILKSLGRGVPAASVFLAGLNPLVAAAFSSSNSASLNSLVDKPAFEQDSGPGATGYVWRDHGVAARFRSAGEMLLQLRTGARIELTFEGGASNAMPRGESPAPPHINYYLGPSNHWHSARRFDRIRYHDLYPGVDLVFVTNAGHLEYNLEIRPGADLGAVKIRYHGATTSLDPQGDLEIRAGQEVIRQKRPRAFQSNGSRELECSYRRDRSGVITLSAPTRDPRENLLIDPVLNFSTYLGGPSFDAANAAAIDSAGNVYLTGETSSGTMRGSALPDRSSRDVWVAKLDSSGTQVLYMTYAGGSGNDSGKGIAVDSAGNAYITGYTSSTDFPTTSGALNSHSGGAEDAFVLKLDPNGNVLYSTYLGGSGSDHGLAIAVDTAGSAYIAGQTGSVAFPTTPGVLQTSNHGGLSDCFVSKLNPGGNSLTYSTYLGGLGLDLCAGIAVDTSGNAYVTGTTYSFDFPTQSPLQGSLTGTANAFAAKINAYGSALLYSTFLGGSIMDNGNAIALDSSGSAYVAGCTASPDFPTSLGVVQIALAGAYNAFVAKLSPAGNSLTYSTFLGGSGSDDATAITVDALGQAVVGGYTSSANFPTMAPLQTAFGGAFDAFAAVLNSSATALVFSSYFGGGSDDRAYGIGVLSGSRLFLAGTTSSSDFPTANAIAKAFDGNYDAFGLSATYYQTPTSNGLAFYSLLPCRVVDTRSSGGSGRTGAFGPPYMKGGVTRDFPIPQGSCSVPPSALAYALSVSVVPRAGPMPFLTIWPTGSPMPLVSTLNAMDGLPVANAAIVPAGTNGSVSVYVYANADVMIDVSGYFALPNAPQASAFYPVAPCRIADTRSVGGSGKTGPFGPPQMSGHSTRTFPIPSSSCGIPGTAEAYSLNVTVVPPKALSYLTAWPAGLPLPNTTTLNSSNGTIVANAAIVPAGAGGGISVYVSNTTDVVIDINGYFGPPGPGSQYFYPLAPCRIVDTRAVGGSGITGVFGPPQMKGQVSRDFPIPSSPCHIPTTALAYSLNMTVVPPGYLAFLTTWPAGEPMPLVSTLNDLTGKILANAAIVPAGAAGAISVYVYNPTDLVIDTNGYFAP